MFRAGDTEVGIFVEPTEAAARAFRRTSRHAVSIRVRDGSPVPQALEALVDWFTVRLHAAEQTNDERSMPLLDPPPPWHRVDTTTVAGRLS